MLPGVSQMCYGVQETHFALHIASRDRQIFVVTVDARRILMTTELKKLVVNIHDTSSYARVRIGEMLRSRCVPMLDTCAAPHHHTNAWPHL